MKKAELIVTPFSYQHLMEVITGTKQSLQLRPVLSLSKTSIFLMKKALNFTNTDSYAMYIFLIKSIVADFTLNFLFPILLKIQKLNLTHYNVVSEIIELSSFQIFKWWPTYIEIISICIKLFTPELAKLENIIAASFSFQIYYKTCKAEIHHTKNILQILLPCPPKFILDKPWEHS